MPFGKPKFEPAPDNNKYPTGKDMKKGKKLKCTGCKSGQTLNGPCQGCQGTGFITV